MDHEYDVLTNNCNRNSGVLLLVRMPEGKDTNFLSMQKLVNNLRMKNFSFTASDQANAARMCDEIRMITKDNEAACICLNELGATVEALQVAAPKVDLDYCPYASDDQEGCGVTLGHRHDSAQGRREKRLYAELAQGAEGQEKQIQELQQQTQQLQQQSHTSVISAAASHSLMLAR